MTTVNRDQRNAEIWEAILRTFPMDNPGEAHFKMLVDFCQGELSVERVSHFFANPPQGWNLPLISLDKRREQLITEIIELEQEYRISDHQLRQNKIKYESTYSLAQLRAQLVEILLKREWAKKTPDQIRAGLKELRSEGLDNRYPNYPRLLREIVPPGQVFAVPTRSYLMELAKSDIFTFKKFVRLYSLQQINDILNQQ